MQRILTTLISSILCLVLAAQEVPEILVREYQGDYFYLADELRDDRNYIITTTAHWCGWCKKAFSEWVNCYDELAPKYNLEIIALSSDGYEDSEQRIGYNQIQDIGIPIQIWFATSAAIREAFDVRGYPTNIYIRSGKEYIGKVGGYATCEKLQDTIATYFPLAAIDSTLYHDLDGDGYNSFFDCNDEDPVVHPGATEIRYNGIDDDCNSNTRDDDIDLDGYGIADDCDDSRISIYPGAEEVCDFLDNNCDDLIDEGFEHYQHWWDNDGDGYGNSTIYKLSCQQIVNGWVTNGDDCDDNNPLLNPDAVEIPNNSIDENCDGMDFISAVQEDAGVGFKLFPNPVKHTLHLTVDIPDYRVVILSMDGRVLKSYVANEIMDLADLASGLYLVEVISDDRSSRAIKRFIKL